MALPPELSLCMIVRNEERCLGQCLKSLKGAADEVVIVDTGSTDRTCEIAHRSGARVFQMPWPESFAAARNESLRLAKGRWILWLDADDTADAAFCRGVREVVRSCPARNAAFHVAVRIPPGKGEYSWSVVDHVKLFPNRDDLRFDHRIHEQILPAIRQAGLAVEFTDLYVTHTNYDRSPEGQAVKRRRDFRLLELDLQDKPEHPFVLFNLGMTYLEATRDYVVAAQYLQRCLARSHPSDSIVRKAYAMLTTALFCQSEAEAAIRANEQGRSFYPDDAELLLQAGKVYSHLNRFDEARRALEQLIAGADTTTYRSAAVDLRDCQGNVELALLYLRMGDAPHAERRLRELGERHADYVPAREALIEVLLRQGRETEARRIFAILPPEAQARSEFAFLWKSVPIQAV